MCIEQKNLYSTHSCFVCFQAWNYVRVAFRISPTVIDGSIMIISSRHAIYIVLKVLQIAAHHFEPSLIDIFMFHFERDVNIERKVER